MLNCYRVLDLTDAKGYLCGKIMADLGADVVKIEKPGGDADRNKGPFYKNDPHPEKSLYWFAFNLNKKSVTLDIETADGQEIFKRLVKKADVVLHSFVPDYMDQLGLGYSQLSEINPGLIMTAITGFGSEGPFRKYKASDNVVWAQSGMMYITGDPDRPPLTPSYPHCFLFASAQAALGTMIALFHRSVIGKGQFVDVSAQMSVLWPTSPFLTGMYDIEGKIGKREGRTRVQSFTGKKMPVIWKCKDGEVAYAFMLGPGLIKGNIALAEWIQSENSSVTVFRGIDWKNFTPLDLTDKTNQEITEALTGFFSSHTKKELFDGCMERKIRLYPALTPIDTLEFEQLAARDFWADVYHEELGDTITYPGDFMKSTEGKVIQRKRAPLIGEHNREIYQDELGFSSEDLTVLKTAGII